MRMKQTAAMLLAILAVTSTPSHATDMGTDLQNQFNIMSNVTHPGAYQSASRGVLDGGSVYLRNPVMTVHPITITPPSISAGCHGIDLRGGSLSFISASQFIDALRAIASNAPSYAFSQALAGMCPQCFQIIKDLQNDIQHINSLSMNSCKTAENLVDAPFADQGGLAGYIRNVSGSGTAQQAADDGTSEGYFSQALDSAQSFMDGTTNIWGTNGGKAADQTGKQGNSVHRLMSQTQPQFDMNGFDPQYINYVMSMIGTTVDWMDSTQPGSLPSHKSYPPTISLSDLVNGNPSVAVFNCSLFDDANDTNDADGNLTPPDTSDDCLDPSATPVMQTVKIKGLYDSILPLLTSDPGGLMDQADATTDPGIVEIWAYNVSKPTDQQMKLVGALPGNMGAALYKLSKVNIGGARDYAQDIARSASLYFAYQYASNVLHQAGTVGSSAITSVAANAMPLITDAIKKLDADHQVLTEQNSTTEHLAQEFDALFKLRDSTRVRPFASTHGAALAGSHN